MDEANIQKNACLTSPGLAIDGGGSPDVEWVNTFSFRANGLISDFISPDTAPSLATATRVAALPNGVAALVGNLPGDNGSVNTGILCARIYTLVATLNAFGVAETFSWLAGADFTKYEYASTRYLAQPQGENQTVVGYVIVQNTTASDFVPGTTALDTGGLNVTYIENSIVIGGGSLLASGDIWVGNVGGVAVGVTPSGDLSMDNAGVFTVFQSTGDFNVGGALTGAVTASIGPGAVAITNTVHEITTTGTGDALTLADGQNAQVLDILYIDEAAGGDTAVLTPSNLLGGTTITFTDVGDTARLVFSANAGAWFMVGGSAVIA